MKLPHLLLCMLLWFCRSVQASASSNSPSDTVYLTQEEKNKKLQQAILDANYYKVHSLLEQGARVDRKNTFFFVNGHLQRYEPPINILCTMDPDILRLLLQYDDNKEPFSSDSYQSGYCNPAILKVLSTDKRFDLKYEHALLDFPHNIKMVPFLYYMGALPNPSAQYPYVIAYYQHQLRKPDLDSSSRNNIMYLLEILTTPPHALMRKYITPEQEKEYRKIKLARELGTQNVTIFLEQRRMGPGFALHQQHKKQLRTKQILA